LRSVTDIYALKASVSDMQMNIALQKAETEIAQGKLAACLGLDVDSQLIIASMPDPELDSTMQAGLKQLIVTAQQKRSDLIAKRYDLQQKIAQQTRINKACLPKLSVKGDTGYRRFFEDKANGYNYNVGLFLDIPIFNGFEQIYQKKVALSDVQLSEIEIERMELEIALEVLTYHRWFNAAQEVLKLANENLQNSIKTFDGVLDKYKAGTQSIFELTAAQKQLADARLKNGEAKTRWYRSLAQLAYATGTINPSTEVSCVTVQ
ncbi:MAG: TolC family protein, partial [Parachlamydiaceae bacterium]|nr:TolC family protein [Parachlamydiaceae bacterium]